MQLAFLGLGVMGTPMTVNLAQAQYSINAWNRTPNKENIGVASLRDDLQLFSI